MDIRRSPRRLVHGLGTSLAVHETDGLALEATRHGWPEADGAALAARTQLEATISAWTGSGTSTGSWMIRPAAWLARVRSRRPDRPLDPPLSAARDAFPQGIPDPGATPGGRRPRCENTPASEPAPGPRTGGSLPSTSVLPSAAQAAGWQRPRTSPPRILLATSTAFPGWGESCLISRWRCPIRSPSVARTRPWCCVRPSSGATRQASAAAAFGSVSADRRGPTEAAR